MAKLFWSLKGHFYFNKIKLEAWPNFFQSQSKILF